MNVADRVLGTFNTTDVPLFTSRGIVTTTSPDTTTGADLVESLTRAQRQIKALTYCVEQMKAALNGETEEERAARIAHEDLNPEAPARAGGWAIWDDYRRLYDAQGLPFAHWLPELGQPGGQRIAKMHPFHRERAQSRGRYPERHECVMDYFSFADSWAQALAKTRTEARAAKAKERNEHGV